MTFWKTFKLVHQSSICACHGGNQCELMHQLYYRYTNHKLSKMYPGTDDSLLTLYTFASTASNYGTSGLLYFDTLAKGYNVTAHPHPLPALFGSTSTCSQPVESHSSVASTAQLTILLWWKCAIPSLYFPWINDFL